MSKTRIRGPEGPDGTVVGDIGDFRQLDFLTCGSCQKEFLLSNIVSFMRHKKLDCDDSSTADSTDFYYRLICQIKECKEQFATAWALLQHVQTRHIPNIYTALQLYGPGIESIHVQTSHRPPVTTSSSTFTSVQQTGVDVRSLCMLGLGDTFDDISPSDIQDIQVEKLKDDDVGGKRSTEAAPVTFTSTETQTDVMQICTDAKCNAENCSEMKCCDDQNCCITIIPGTHEKPRKCCSAIVPKKRKQHMEAKHMPSGQSGVSTRSQKRIAGEQRRAGELQRRAADRQYSISSKNDTIYIDFTQSNMDASDEFQDTPEGSPMPADQDDKFSRTVSVSNNSVMISSSSGLQQTAGTLCTSKGSMIIQPGSTVTIPPPIQSVFPTPSVLPSPVTPGLRPLAPRPTNLIQDSIPAVLTFPYLMDSQTLPKLNQQKNVTSINISSGSDKDQKFFITSSKPFTPALSSNGVSQHDPGESLTISSPGSPQDSKSVGDDTLDLRAGGKKRRYPTSRPFKCDQCGNSFNQRIHLKKHLSKHTGIKPYKCGQCDYSTVERSHLKVHIRIHTGEKPFKCTFCEYATAQNSTLKIHLKRHHSGKQMGCSICGKAFNQPIQLKNHLKDEHGVAIDLQSVSGDEQSKLEFPDTSNDDT